MVESGPSSVSRDSAGVLSRGFRETALQNQAWRPIVRMNLRLVRNKYDYDFVNKLTALPPTFSFAAVAVSSWSSDAEALTQNSRKIR